MALQQELSEGPFANFLVNMPGVKFFLPAASIAKSEPRNGASGNE
jgi:hypothetical protein